LCLNESPEAIKLLESNFNKINWYYLSYNPIAINLLIKNFNKIIWSNLSKNENAIELLEANPDKIDWNQISRNPAIFTYDYDLIKERKKELNEEIYIKSLHPKRMLKLMQEYGEDEIYNCYF